MTERVPPRAVIIGIAGVTLAANEGRDIRQIDPAGIILFRRNIRDPDQVKKLVIDLKNILQQDNPIILVDQEGGRVRRLSAPPWPAFPAAGSLAAHPLGLTAAAILQARLMAETLIGLGITVNCAPVLDIRAPDSHDAVLGDRCFGMDAETVIAGGAACFIGHQQAGMVAVMKHLPGHGRARVDSHYDLPVIDSPIDDLQQHDFRPFQHLAGLRDHRLWGMTAHIVLPMIDAALPATLSQPVIDRVIRGQIGFDGILLSDDIEMGALSGTIAARIRQSLAAGCDAVLHCSGKIAPLVAMGADIPRLSPARWDLMRLGLEQAQKQRLAPWTADEYQHHLSILLGAQPVMAAASDRASDPTAFVPS